jgi:hypothetical protein
MLIVEIVCMFPHIKGQQCHPLLSPAVCARSLDQAGSGVGAGAHRCRSDAVSVGRLVVRRSGVCYEFDSPYIHYA